MKKIIACICIALAAFAAGHFATIYTLEIETDGDGDSASTPASANPAHVASSPRRTSGPIGVMRG